MIKCPKCQNSDIYYEDTICVWQNPDGVWELDDEEVTEITGRDKNNKCLICNECGKMFYFAEV